jgi:hypothetical protein
VRQVASGLRVRPEWRAQPEPRDLKALLGQRGRKGHKVCQAWPEPLGRKGQRVRPVQLVQQARRETPGQPARKAWLVPPELRGQQGHKATQGRRGRPAWLVPLARKAHKERRELPEQQVLLGRRGQLERRATRVLRGQLDRKARKGLLEQQVPLVPLAHRGRRVLQEQPARKARPHH